MPSDTAQADRGQPPPTIPWQALFFKTALLGGLTGLALWLIVRLSVVTTPILVGFFIAYALNPAVVRLRRWRVPPFLALTIPVLAVVALAVVFVTVVLPTMAHQLLLASQHAPARLFNAVLRADPWFQEQFGQPLSAFVQYDNLSGMIQSLATELFGPARSVLGVVLTSARDLLLALGNIVLVVIVAFFLLEDYERVLRVGASLVPLRDLQTVTRIVARIDGVLAGFLRGELLLFSLATVAFTLGLALLDVPFALVIGPLVAMIYLVPYVGVVAGLVLCVSMSLLVGHGPLNALGVALLFLVFYTTDLLFITPRLIGNRVGLRPIVVLLGIIAFGELFGVIGVLIAIPILATARILVLEAIERYRRSTVYLGTSGAAAAPGGSPPRWEASPSDAIAGYAATLPTPPDASASGPGSRVGDASAPLAAQRSDIADRGSAPEPQV